MTPSFLALLVLPALAVPLPKPLDATTGEASRETMIDQVAFQNGSVTCSQTEPEGPAVTLPLGERPDASRRVIGLSIGGKSYQVGVAGTKGFAERFVVLESEAGVRTLKLSDFRAEPCVGFVCFRGEEFELDGQQYYLYVKILPLERSSWLAVYKKGSRQAEQTIRFGEITDLIRRERAFAFQSPSPSPQEIGVLQSPVMAPGGASFTGEQTLLFMRKKAVGYDGWPVHAPDLRPGAWCALTLGSGDQARTLHLRLERDGGVTVKAANPL